MIREVFRYGRPYQKEPQTIDGFRNHFAVTDFANHSMVLLEKGINQVAAISNGIEKRVPAIIIRSSPHKIGSETTPWQDIFDVDNGHIRYYGDNKMPGNDPSNAPGNKVLLAAFTTYNDVNCRVTSVPLLFYKAVNRNNKSKGYIEFNGYGIITGVELITQYDRKLDRTFANYAFNFQVFSLAKDNEVFDWNWINDRRNRSFSLKDTLRYAPNSWKSWIKEGNKSLERCRRRVSKLQVKSRVEQLPTKGSAEETILKEIYDYYHGKKCRFEALAAKVTTKILRDVYGKYQEGWITRSTSDNGVDFYGRLDIGSGFGKAKLIVLGQAKCEITSSPTNGNDIARTVARLKRGWFGVYVTTSFFSEPVQIEIIEDQYPIMLVNGKKIAETVLKILHDESYTSVKKLLDEIDVNCDFMIQNRRPEELLIE